jgi:predicted nucleic acid-binding protein
LRQTVQGYSRFIGRPIMYLLDTNAIIDYLNNKLSSETNILMDNVSIPQISIATRIELSILPNADEKQIEIIYQ